MTGIIETLEERIDRLEKENESMKTALFNSLYIDALTGIHNRTYYVHNIERLWKNADRYALPLTTIVIDVDHFKKANTMYGYDQANDILVSIAQTLTQAPSRPDDIYARFGGDEFVVVLHDTDLDGARYMADELCQRVIDANIYHGAAPQLIATISAGAATCHPANKISYPTHGKLFKHACDALVAAKENGKAQAVHFDDLPTKQAAAA